jgi:hypothetical protein
MEESDERPGSMIGRNFAQTWPGLCLATMLAVAGCQAPAAPFDPFMAGRTTIAPPGTAVVATAAPAAAAPYYEAGPPVVSVPGASTIYPPPGAIPATVPAGAVPPAASPRFPRGQTIPQASAETVPGVVQLAGWQAADSSEAPGSATSASTVVQPDQTLKAGVVRASHEAPSSEPPLRIVAPSLESKL